MGPYQVKYKDRNADWEDISERKMDERLSIRFDNYPAIKADMDEGGVCQTDFAYYRRTPE